MINQYFCQSNFLIQLDSMKQSQERSSEDNRNTLQQHQKSQFIYPLGFSDFNRIREIQRSQYTVKDYHHLLKLKKMLQNTEKKMSNRINLFRKASQKIIKRRYKQNALAQKIINAKNSKLERQKQFEKIENKENHIEGYQFQDLPFSQNKIKNSDKISRWTRAGTPLVRNIPLSAKTTGNIILKHHQKIQSPDIHQIQQKLTELKFSNAKNMKEERQRYKMIIAQRKKQQVNRNLKSAENVRKNRENAKIIKMEIQKQRRQATNKTIEQKVKRQKEQYIQLQRNLDYLQKQQREALIAWKKTLDA